MVPFVVDVSCVLAPKALKFLEVECMTMFKRSYVNKSPSTARSLIKNFILDLHYIFIRKHGDLITQMEDCFIEYENPRGFGQSRTTSHMNNGPGTQETHIFDHQMKDIICMNTVG